MSNHLSYSVTFLCMMSQKYKESNFFIFHLLVYG